MNTLTVMQNAEERDRLAAEYQTMSEEFGKLTSQMDMEWLRLRTENTLWTDKRVEKTVGASKLGQRFNELKFKMKGYEKRMSSLNGIITVANNEARNLY